MKAFLDKYDLIDCNPTCNPLPSGFRPIPATDEEFALANHRPYPQVVGAVSYADTVSTPDLAHAAGVLFLYISKWAEQQSKP